MATLKVKQTGKTLYRLTMGPKEVRVIAALLANCASNSHAYRMSNEFETIVAYPNVTVSNRNGYPVINVEQE